MAMSIKLYAFVGYAGGAALGAGAIGVWRDVSSEDLFLFSCTHRLDRGIVTVIYQPLSLSLTCI